MSDQWHPADTAPLGATILGDFGWPMPIAARWNAEEGRWATAMLQKDDERVWWEGDTEDRLQLRRWMKWPHFPAE